MIGGRIAMIDRFVYKWFHYLPSIIERNKLQSSETEKKRTIHPIRPMFSQPNGIRTIENPGLMINTWHIWDKCSDDLPTPPPPSPPYQKKFVFSAD